ncbi:MAG TPA: methyltransferase domain-containing protein [Bryobacteraceae bacterium]|nr:methyltransferase domain-containing protein [Bryobacteraceae bacterium]
MSRLMKWDAATYESSCSFVWKASSDLLDLLNPQPGERILDIGCGTGHLTNAIAERGAEVVGLDASPDMLGQARRNYPNLRFVLADASSFRFDESFDAVFSNAVLHWVRDADGVVRSVAAALRSGGRFVTEFGGKGNVAQLLAAAKHVIPSADNPWYFPDIPEYTSLLARHGLETRHAALFDRPTPLDGSVQEWYEMFGQPLLASVPKEARGAALDEIARVLRPALFHDGQWWADYRRLRIAAYSVP